MCAELPLTALQLRAEEMQQQVRADITPDLWPEPVIQVVRVAGTPLAGGYTQWQEE